MRYSIKNTREEVDKILEDVPIDFGGGCSVSKATVLAYLIRSQNIERSIDIGIYRGRSFFPQAVMHKKYTSGTVYGVDPYSNEEAMEYDHKELAKDIANFAHNTNFNAILKDVNKKLTKLGAKKNAVIVRKTSNSAIKELSDITGGFGLIHIDGNHDTKAVMDDIDNYLPLLNKNGFLVLDDISWSSVRPAVEYAKERLVLIYTRVDGSNDYAVFWKGNSTLRKYFYRHVVSLAGEN